MCKEYDLNDTVKKESAETSMWDTPQDQQPGFLRHEWGQKDGEVLQKNLKRYTTKFHV